MTADKVRENRLRRKADRIGWKLHKSRRRDPDAYDFGLYALTDIRTGGLVHRDNVNSIYALTLDDVETWLSGESERIERDDLVAQGYKVVEAQGYKVGEAQGPKVVEFTYWRPDEESC